MSPDTLPLAGRVAVVVGGTGGVGSAVCQTLARVGAHVVRASRRNEAVSEVLDRPCGQRHTSLQADVTDSASLGRLEREVERLYGTVDLLVNSAGMTRFVPHANLDELDDQLIDDIFQTNWRGPFATIRALRPLLANGEGGLIVNISSIAGVSGVGSNVAYCASKAALNSMTVSLARALAPAIRVVSVSPGLVDTAFVKGLDPGWRDQQEAATPLGRLTSADDVGRAVLALATALSFSTGCVLTVDGGRLIG